MRVQLPPGVFLPKIPYFVVANSVGYLRADARVPTVYLPRLRLELGHFSLKTQPIPKNREPGLQENSVRNFTGRKRPPGVFLPLLLAVIPEEYYRGSSTYGLLIHKVFPFLHNYLVCGRFPIETLGNDNFIVAGVFPFALRSSANSFEHPA